MELPPSAPPVPPMAMPPMTAPPAAMPAQGTPPAAAMPVPPPLDPKLWQRLSPEQQINLMNLLKGMGSQPEGTPFYGMEGQPVGPQNMLPPSERDVNQEPLRF